jgi:competence ComEA-like helix-hairpin-helix protein
MDPAAPAEPRTPQFLVAIVAAAGLCLLAYRGYGPPAMPRPAEPAAKANVAETLIRGESNPAEQPALAPVEVLQRKPAADRSGSLDINSATEGELQQLPAVGPVLAKRIVETRNTKKFENVDDLRRVPGIGAKTLEKLRPHVRCGN